MANEGDAERLVVLLEARITDFERNMAKASGTAGKSYGQMRRDSKTATERMEADMVRSTSRINQALAATSSKIGTVATSLLAGFAGGLIAGGLAGTVTRLGQIASGVAAIGDEAKRAGVDIKSFQELKYVAEQNRISVDALTDGMKELNLRADEWIVTGGGSAAEAFTRLGYTAEELNTKLQNPSALLSEIIGKVQGLDRAAQIRIFDELFGGTGGEQFVQLIAQGEEGIRRTIDEANNLGIVLDEKVIAKAAEVDRKFNQVVNTVGSALKQAIVEATGALVEFMNSLPKSASQQFEDLTVEIDGTKDTLVQLANSAGNLFPELEPQIRDAVVQFLAGKTAAEDAKQALLDMAKGRPDLAPIIGDMNGLISTLEMVMAKAREAAAAARSVLLKDIGVEEFDFQDLQTTFTPPVPKTVPGSGAGSRASGTSEIERQEKALRNLIAGLEFEKSLIGLSAVEQEKLNALRSVSVEAMSAEGVQIAALIQQVNDGMTATQIIAENKTPFETLAESMEELDGLLERGALSWEQYGRAAAAAQANAVASTLGSLSQMTGMLSQAFEDNKMLATANAVVKGGEAIASAFAAGNAIGGPPVGFAFASVAGIASAAQIAAINSTTKSSKSLSGGGGGGASAPVAAPAAAPGKTLNVTFVGSGKISTDELRERFAEMAEFMNNGGGQDFKIALGGI